MRLLPHKVLVTTCPKPRRKEKFANWGVKIIVCFQEYIDFKRLNYSYCFGIKIEWAESLLKSRQDELSFLGWVNRPKGKAYDSRLLLVTKYRFFFVTAKYKVKNSVRM